MTPAPETVTYTREELYEMLWQAPARDLAKEIGISDVLLGKICKEYRIPKPYVGYWAKKEHGKDPARTPLPRCDEAELQALTFYKYPDQESAPAMPPPPEYDEDIRAVLDKATKLRPIKARTSLRDLHPLVEATKDVIEQGEPDWQTGLVTAFGSSKVRPLSISVSKACLRRGLLVLDALIRAVEAVGGRVTVIPEKGNERRSQTIIEIGGAATSVRVREKCRQRRVKPDEKRSPWDSGTQLVPSGLLVIDEGPGYVESILCRDTPKRKRLEEQLNDFLIDLVHTAGQARIRRREEEEERRRRDEEERIRREREAELERKRADLLRRQEEERARVKKLVDAANAWRQAGAVRRYIQAVKAAATDASAEENRAEFDEWALWAAQQADRLDPLTPSPGSVLDERLPGESR